MNIESGTGHSVKAQVRTHVRHARAAMSDSDIFEHDAARTAAILKRIWDFSCVACYVSAGHEPDTMVLLEELANQARPVLLPVFDTITAEPRWARWSGEALAPGPLGIAQPTSTPLPAATLGEADCIIMPGLAATEQGVRLGRGGRWYDRALSWARPEVPRWLLLNQGEVLPDLPHDPWDEPVSAIVTERGWIDIAPLGHEGQPHPTR